MATTNQQRAQCVLGYAKFESVKRVQREFRREYGVHVSGRVNTHNCIVWARQNPHISYELERSSPKVNVWSGVSRNKVYGPFFFAEKTIRLKRIWICCNCLCCHNLSKMIIWTLYSSKMVRPHTGHGTFVIF
ncbi:hypothetical protein C0J52_15254 [Blattella germanica]|nr:hypothetical protein C0J52_15254 [Blattella germanica]